MTWLVEPAERGGTKLTVTSGAHPGLADRGRVRRRDRVHRVRAQDVPRDRGGAGRLRPSRLPPGPPTVGGPGVRFCCENLSTGPAHLVDGRTNAGRYFHATSPQPGPRSDPSRDGPDRGPGNVAIAPDPRTGRRDALTLKGSTVSPARAGRRQQRDDPGSVRLRPPGEPRRGRSGSSRTARARPRSSPAATASSRCSSSGSPSRRSSSTSRTSTGSTASSRPTTSSASAPGRRTARSTRTRSSRTATRSSTTSRAGSATRRSATGARSAAPSPTPIRPPTGRPSLLARERPDRLPRAAAASATIEARDFFLDTFTTAIEPTEVLTEIRIPRRGRSAPAAPTRSSSARSATSPPPASRPSSGSATTARSSRPGSASRASPSTPFAATDAEAAPRRQAPSDEASTAQAGAAAAAAEPARPRTSAVPSTTSGRWSPS